MTKHLLAIEIGAENLKAAVLHQSKTGYQIAAYKIMPLSEKAYDLDGMLHMIEVKPTLEEAIHRLKAAKLPVALTINSNKKIVRTRDLPIASLKDLDGIVRYEAEQFLPYGIDQFYTDYRVIGSGTLAVDGSEKDKATIEAVKVMIAALPKEILNQYLELLSACSCKVSSVTLHTDALFSYAKRHYLEQGKSHLICDIGSNSINTILFENMEFLADISSDSGMASIVTHFSQKHGIEAKQSKACLLGLIDMGLSKTDTEVDQLYRKIEKLNQFVNSDFIEKNADTHAHDAVDENHLQEAEAPAESAKKYMASDAIEETQSELYVDILKEISRMMEFYRTRRFGARVDQIYICGGGAKLLGLQAFLSKRLDTANIQMISQDSQHRNFEDGDLDLLVAAIGGALGR